MKKDQGLVKPVFERKFWFFAALIAALLAGQMAIDITRPFCGLHSWAQASGAWVGRTHYKYGYGYTKGISTWAVGDPPTENPRRYYSHPQLGGNLRVIPLILFGVHEWSFRVMGIIVAIPTLLLFLRILRGLMGAAPALLAGLVYALLPLNTYFGTGGWEELFLMGALFLYLASIRALKDGPEPKAWHKWGLGICLFLMLQLSWNAFFYAFAIGVHYVLRCVWRRQRPDVLLLSILVFAPLLSCAVTFGIMYAGFGGEAGKIVDLYKWRAAKGEMASFDWKLWLSAFWQKAVTNFTMPAIFAAFAYITLGQFLVLRSEPRKKKKEPSSFSKWRFPQFWLFVAPGIMLLLVFRGLVWRHEYWQRSLVFFIAIGTALFVLLVADILRRFSKQLAIAWAVVFIGGFAALAAMGTKHYYGIRWQPEAKIEMFKMLNRNIPPDKALLSYDPYMTDQNEVKGAFYRPEIAWCLDREIVPARSWKFEEIQKFAATGKYPYYLVPEFPNELRAIVYQLQNPNLDAATRRKLTPIAEQRYAEWKAFIESLKRAYQYQRIEGVGGELRKPYPLAKKKIFYRAGMDPQLIFDLNSPAQAQADNSRQ